MGKSKAESLLSSIDKKLSISRRGFVKGTVAVGAAAALYGCSKDSGGDVIYGGGTSSESPDAPAINEDVFAGSSPHNCGGGCVIKAYVKDGVIKRFTTDETPEKTYLDTTPGDYMQERACPRCRSQKSWIYSSNRLMYPLIQTKERGDLSGFKRVSWAEAAAYFKAKSEKVVKKWGPGAFHSLYSSGMGGGYNPSGDMFALVGASGSNMMETHDDYSFPQWELITRCMHDANSQPRSNDFQDVYNADELVIWGYNLSEMLNQQQINFTLAQIKDIFAKDGRKITVIDPKYTNTAILGADEFIAPVQGTDTAMICGMIHYILSDATALAKLKKMYETVLTDATGGAVTITSNDDLRKAVGKYVYGFFDTLDADGDAVNGSYMLDGADATDFKTKAKVAPGASFAAYVFGSSNKLQTAGLNQGVSVYPNEIGYNVRPYQIDGKYDQLWDEAANRSKKTMCYGQVEKTPEWAATICGVPAATIRKLADKFLDKKIHCWMMGGLQRNSEGDQACWSWTVLMNFLLCFGLPGRSHGRADGRGNDLIKSLAMSWKSGIKTAANVAAIQPPTDVPNYLTSDNTKWSAPLGDMTLLSFPNNYNSNHSSTDISVFTWLDAADATNRPKVSQERWTMNGGAAQKVTEQVNPSYWNDGQVKRIPTPTKFIFHCGGNININQNGDCNMAVDVLTAKDSNLVDNNQAVSGVAMNPNGYKVEFLGMIEVVMTSSCRWADLILPGSISFERYQSGSSRSPLRSITTKAVNPPGDAKVEMEIGAEMAKAFGQESDYYNGMAPAAGESFEKKVWEATLNNPTNVATFGMDAKMWKTRGIHKSVDDLSKLPNYIAYPMFLKTPGNTNRPSASGSVGKGINATKTCFRTLSGRVEAYCLPMMENYEMRMGNNIDEGIDLANSGQLYTKIADARTLKGKGRFCYPIPMYIPLIEGRHADSSNDSVDSHPDPLGLKTDYPFNLLTWHTIYRSHSTFNSSPLVNEVKYYKRNAKGEAAYLNRNITNINAGLDNNDLQPSDTVAAQVWTDDVYETVWINPKTASQAGVVEWDVIIVESLRGKIAASVHISNRVRFGTISMTQGSWYDPILNWVSPTGKTYDKVDVGGNANTLFGLRPCRIAHGMSLASECRVKIYKA